VSALAREASASAARSLFGGFVALEAGAERAERVCDGQHLPLAMLVAVTEAGEKSTGSTDGMQHTAATSPYYPAWVTDAPRIYARVRAALMARDFEALGAAAEQSALAMHASMLAADPAVIYFAPATLAVMHRVRELRKQGWPAFFTMDAGPHVKVLTLPERARELEAELSAVPGVTRLIATGPGPDASVELL
jgi:diphosphomevalonate decarboxylase